jgi:hypothetical protein
VKILLLILFVPIYLLAQFTPQKYLKKPVKYFKPTEIINEANNDKSDQVWEIYSDRANNQTYETANSGQPKMTIGFMDAFVVLEEKENYLHIYKDTTITLNGSMGKNAVDFGWIPKENMLLWGKCLLTESGSISLKAMILNTIRTHLTNDSEKPEKVQFRKGPDQQAEFNGKSSDLFEFYFIIKKIDDWVLLSKTSTVSPNLEYRREDFLGWAPESRVISWNTTVTVEPNWERQAVNERKGINAPARVFVDQRSAAYYAEKHQILDRKYVLWDEDPFENRMNAQWRRFPVLEPLEDGTLRVGAMGGIKAGNMVVKGSKMAEVQEKIATEIDQKRKVSIVFVVDGTNSMGPYFSATREAIRSCMKQIKNYDNRNKYRFGSVIYRDQPEGDRICNVQELQEDENKVYDFLNPKECYDLHDRDAAEAVFYGLNEALYNTKLDDQETNLIILIGDAGNHTRDDESQVPIENVIKALSIQECNFLAFQVNNPGGQAYNDFVDQCNKIILDVAMMKYEKIKGSNSVLKKPTLVKVNDTYSIEGGVYVATVVPVNKGSKLQESKLTKEVINAITRLDKDNNERIKGLQDVYAGKKVDDVIKEKQIQEPSKNKSPYSSDYGPGIYYLLQKAGVNIEDLKILNENKYQMMSDGYISPRLKNISNEIFRTVLFVTKEELYSSIVKPMADVSDATNSREEIQKAWKSMVKTRIGKMSSVEMNNMTLSDWQEKIMGIQSNSKFLKNVKIDDIIDPNKFTDGDLRQYQKDMKEKFRKVNSIYNAPDAGDNAYQYCFRSNEMTYYWIEESLLP